MDVEKNFKSQKVKVGKIMKKLLLLTFILNFISWKSLSQNLDKLEYVKLLQSVNPIIEGYYTYNDSIYKEFEKTTLLAIFKGGEKIDTLVNFINNENELSGDPTPYYNSHFRYLNNNYKLAKKFQNVPDSSLMDSVLYNEPVLLYSFKDKIDSVYFYNNFYSSILPIAKFLLFKYYSSKGISVSAVTKLLASTRQDFEQYRNLLSYYDGNDIEEIYKVEADYFDRNPHFLLDSSYLIFYKHELLGVPTQWEIEMNLEWEARRRILDSLWQIRRDIEYKEFLYKDSLRYVHYLDTLSGQAKLEYLIWHDTTLVHTDGRMRTVAIADDGYRFDTLSNEDLINRFQILNFDSLMELKIKSTYEINSNVQIVYMHKITQILGDRFLKHTLDPNDPKLKLALDRFDGFVVKLYKTKNFEQIYLQSQIKQCYLRLWLLIEPYMLARLDSCKSINVLDFGVWHYMMDESRVKYLHDKAAEAIMQGDLVKAKCYIAPMEEITLNAQPLLKALPPRRNAIRNIDISYDWYEKYHLPILEKLGLR